MKEEKKEEDTAEDSAKAEDDAGITASSNTEVAKSSKCEDPETGDMIHTPQFHHPHHPHHRTFHQVRTSLISLPVGQNVPVPLITACTQCHRDQCNDLRVQRAYGLSIKHTCRLNKSIKVYLEPSDVTSRTNLGDMSSVIFLIIFSFQVFNYIFLIVLQTIRFP